MKHLSLLPSLFALLFVLAPAWGQTNTGTSLTVGTLTTGTVLDVRAANISADGRYVTMSLQPTFSSLDGIDTFGTGSTIGGAGTGVRAFGIRSLPFRPAQVRNVVFVEPDKTLLPTAVPAVKFDNVPFSEAIRKVSTLTKTNMALSGKAFKEANVDDHAPITLDLPAQSLKDDLSTMLTSLTHSTPLVVTAEDKVIFITTRDQADHNVVTKYYYAEDLMANIPRFVAAATDLGVLGPAEPEPQVPDLSAYVPVMSPPPKPVAAKPRRASTSFSEVITSTVRPEIWKVNGGKYGEIAEVKDKVVITAPQYIHALLEGPSRHNPNAAPMYVNYGTR